MVLAVMSIALAANFWISNPAFNPFGINKNYVGVVFAVLGVWQLVFLNVFHSLEMVRLGLAASSFILAFWGLSNAQQFIAGVASLQLPILYLALAAFARILLVEAPVNPMTEKKA